MTATATARTAASVRKGDVIVGQTAAYSVISKKAQHLGNGEYVVMVRPAIGRAFDLFYSDESLAKGAEAGGYSIA